MRVIDERLDILRAKLATMAELDAERQVFGAENHGWALNAPLCEDEVERFEAEHGVTLPDEYRRFLLRLGNGGAGPYYGLAPLEVWDAEALRDSPPADLARPFPLAGTWMPVDAEGEETPAAWPEKANPFDGCVFLADIGCGYNAFLVVNGNARGAVWEDYTAGDGAIEQRDASFLDWYETWLDAELRGALAEIARAGLGGSAGQHRATVSRYVGLFATSTPLQRAIVAAFLERRDEALRLLEEAESSADLAQAPDAVLLREHLFVADLEAARATPPRRTEALATHRSFAVRVALAQNPEAPAAVLEALAGDHDERVAYAIAANPNATPTAIASLAEAAIGRAQVPQTPFLLEVLARSPRCPDELRERLASWTGDLAEVVIRGVARAATGDLSRFAAHASPVVRHGVAKNPEASAELLARLAGDPDAYVRSAVAAHPRVALASLAELAHDPVADVRGAAARNPALPITMLSTLARERESAVAYGVAHNPALSGALREAHRLHPLKMMPEGDDVASEPEPEVEPSARDAVLGDRVGDAAYPVALLGARVDDPRDLVAYAMARHPWLDEALWGRLSRHRYAYTRLTIAIRHDVPSEILDRLASDKTPMVRASAARNPRLSQERLAELARDPESDVRAGAAENPRLPPALATELARDPETYVRRGVVFHPSPPAHLLATLAADPEPQVRRWIPCNMHATRAQVEALANDPEAEVRAIAAWRLKMDALVSPPS